MSKETIAILGSGSFGRALAACANRNGREVLLWSRKPKEVEGATVTTELSDCSQAELILAAVPSGYVGEIFSQLGKSLDGRHMLVHVSRGLVSDELTPISRVARELTPVRKTGALAGPLDADALREGTPCGAVIGSRFPEVCAATRDAIESDVLRVYDTTDVVGVEVASAMVGLFALAYGFAKGVGVEGAALSMFLTRAMAEAERVAPHLGADTKTLYGLAGMGDLFAVLGGDERPEVLLGEALAKGSSLKDAARAAAAHIEGLSIARRLVNFAQRRRLEVPITSSILSVIDGLSPSIALSRLMARPAGSE